MGELIELEAYRGSRPAPRPPRLRCYLDLADPDAHRLAEHLDRLAPDVRMRVACVQLTEGPGGGLRLAGTVGPAQRAAAYAVACGHGNRFLLAGLRLAHAGGYDLCEPEVLVEAAAAAGLGLEPTLAAARDERWVTSIAATSMLLRRAGVEQLPALQIGRRFVSGAAPITTFLALGGPPPRPRAAL